MNRRQFLASAVALSVGVLASQSASGDEYDERFPHVDIEYEEETLKLYQPLLLLNTESRRALRHQLGYVARSDEYDTFCCVYISRYTHQTGYTRYDSHLWDTEPIYVFVDADTQEVDEVVFTGWHWNAAAVDGDSANLVRDRSNLDTHISLDVIEPWHHYQHAPEREGAFYSLEDWFRFRQLLLDDGLYERGAVEAFEEPWTMHSDHGARAGWWDDSGFISFEGDFPSINTDYTIMRLWALTRRQGYEDRSVNLR